MLLTKFTHACIRLEKAGVALVLDPGTFSEAAEALDGAAAILITHEHADHFDQTEILAALSRDPALQVFAPAVVAGQLRTGAPESAARIQDALPDTEFELAGFSVRTFGGQHALINPRIMPVANIGYLIDGNVFHPGDSFTVPDGVQAQTLLVPIHAPWSKTAEVVDFVNSVRAPKAFQIHDVLLSEIGLQFVEGQVSLFGARYGVEFRHLAVRESVEI